MISRKIHPAFIIFFSLLIVGIAVIFFLGQTYEAGRKPFWGDETFGLEQSIRSARYLDLLTRGARGQGSPSPLDYLAIKAIDDMKDRVNYFGLNPDVYFRLWPNAVTALSATLAVLMLLGNILESKTERSIRFLQIFLLSFVPFSYYFNRFVYYYAAEMRPYALWNSLWLIVLAAGLTSDKKRSPLVIALTLLAMSATASIFQIGAMLAAFLFVDHLQTRSFPNSTRQALKTFLLPLIIAVFYSLQAGQWGYQDQSWGGWKDFQSLWVHKATVIPLMVLVLILCFIKKENHRYAIVPLSALFLYLLGPLIYYLTRLKGFFYAERQYIYYDLTNAVFLMTSIQCLPGLLGDIRGRLLKASMIILVLIIACSVTFRPKLIKKCWMNIAHALEVLHDPSVIK